ncbi:carboxypeptidase regulatory-like domain-containing protein [bacterium]|nr:carboxypeptidase regulatory-like domain-containing protein [bacterium]
MSPVLDTTAMRRMVTALLVFSLLCLAACGGEQQTEMLATPAVLAAHEGLDLQQLPGSTLPELPAQDRAAGPDRNLSFTNIVSYNGIGIFNSSPNCLYPNNSIVLPSSTAETAWALYAFNTGGYQPERLSVDLTCNPGSVAYIAYSDYQSGRWQWQAPTSGPASYDMPPSLYLNSTTQFFVAILTSGGSAATVKSLSVRFDNDVMYDHSVSGTILDEHGEPLASQYIFVNPNPDGVNLVTDVDGTYFIGLPTAGMYSFEPQSMNVAYMPASQNVNVSGAMDGIDFTGTRIDISGRVATAEGVGVPGISLTLNPGSIMTTVSGADGEYSFEGVADGAYTVDPLQAGYSFTPSSQNVNVSGADEDSVDFEASGGQPTFAISGNINDGGSPVPGVAVTLTPGFRLAFTDVNGNYSFTNLAPSQYNLKPTLGKWTFNPVVRLVNLGSANENGIDFAATAPPPTRKVSGQMDWFVPGDASEKYGIPGLLMTLQGQNGNPASYSTYTDNTGYFEFPAADQGNYKLFNSQVAYGGASWSFPLADIDVSVSATIQLKTGGPTWQNFAASYVGNSCTSCHRPDSQTSVSPFLRDYTETKNAGTASNARIQNDTMPPGNPSLPIHKRQFQVWRLASYPLDDYLNP